MPELLAPAGGWECAKAAVANGADAIYFGLERHNARIRADNFTSSELPKLMSWLHEQGVRGYLTMNTLVFEDELAETQEWAAMAARAGVDAVIVQDVGLCRLIREVSPDLPIHGSTQMTVTSAAGVEATRALGCSLTVLARECTIGEIEKIQTSLGERALPLAVFVHGALCVASSGQCLTSESLGGRSANRGVCAQACRMPYDLTSDGKLVDLEGRRYLLSPQDLMGMELLPALVRSGVASLKIEGRLKTPEYVAAITSTYRKALDRLAGIAPTLDEAPQPLAVDPEDRYRMEMTFSRGFHTGWLDGIDNRKLVHATYPKKRGQLLGRVIGASEGVVICELTESVKPGDGVVFDAGDPELREEGGRVWDVDFVGRFVHLGFERGKLRLDRVQSGQRVWKTSDPVLERQLQASWSNLSGARRPVRALVTGKSGEPLCIELRDARGHVGRAASAVPLDAALKRAYTTELLQEQLGRMGDTPLLLGELVNELPEGLFLPVAELNRVRREACEMLLEARRTGVSWRVLPEPKRQDPVPVRPVPERARLSVLVRNLAQLEVASTLELDRVYCELEDPKRFPEALELFRKQSRTELFLVPPRIHKEGEDWILRQCAQVTPDGWLVRNHDQANFFAGARQVGDFCLNVANSRSAAWLLETMNLETVTASCDLNITQLLALVKSAPPEWFEVILHQHMPMFHMEHCVFCAFLTDGKDFRDCGRPCETKEVRLEDHLGASHMIKADAGCRNTVFNARAQTGAEFSRELLGAGVRHFRLDLLDEPPTHLETLVNSYRALLEGRLEGEQLWKDLKLVNQLGVTRGTLVS